MNDRLVFSSQRLEAALGVPFGERVSDFSKYEELDRHPDWRFALGMYWMATDPKDRIEWKGKTYQSLSHAYQAAKFEKTVPNEAFKFCVESGSEIATLATGWEAQQAANRPHLTQKQFETWREVESSILDRLSENKFSPEKTPGKILLATGDAELWICGGRWQPKRFRRLEKLRSRIRARTADRLLLSDDAASEGRTETVPTEANRVVERPPSEEQTRVDQPQGDGDDDVGPLDLDLDGWCLNSQSDKNQRPKKKRKHSTGPNFLAQRVIATFHRSDVKDLFVKIPAVIWKSRKLVFEEIGANALEPNSDSKTPIVEEDPINFPPPPRFFAAVLPVGADAQDYLTALQHHRLVKTAHLEPAPTPPPTEAVPSVAAETPTA